MADFKELVQKRRSHRHFTSEPISPEDVHLLLRAGLMSPTSKNSREWHFVVVDRPESIQRIADAKDFGSVFLRHCPLVIVVAANPAQYECWIEDCSVASASILFQAEDLGLGACWVQMHGRGLSDGVSANEVIRGVIEMPKDFEVLSVIGIGHKQEDRNPQNEDKLKWEQVHINNWNNED